MKCPHSKEECTHLDTAGVLQLIECPVCEVYPSYIRIKDSYDVKQLMEMLPGSIVKKKKNIFRYSEIFDLKIEKDSLNNWVISYINDMNMDTIYIYMSPDLHKTLSIMVAALILNQHIK